VASQATIEIDSFHEEIDFYTTITRARFEELNKDLFTKSILTIERVLQEGKIDKSRIDHVVMAGGSSRIPKIQKLVSEFFQGKELFKSINPDEVVATGAAIQVAILNGNIGFPEPIWGCFMDVCPLSIGIQAAEGLMIPLIPRNTFIIVKKTATVTTQFDNQTSILIAITEGERALGQLNNQLGHLELSGIPPAPRGVPRIELILNIDANGILTASATDKATQKNSKIVITNDKGRLSKEYIERMVVEGEKFRVEDQILLDKMKAKTHLMNYACQLLHFAGIEDLKNEFELSDLEMLKEESSTIIRWVDSNLAATADDYQGKLKELKGIAHSILATTFGAEVDGQRFGIISLPPAAVSAAVFAATDAVLGVEIGQFVEN